MTIKYSKSPLRFLQLVFVIAFSFIVYTNTPGQNNLTATKNSFNNFKSGPDKNDNPAGGRQRIVGKNPLEDVGNINSDRIKKDEAGDTNMIFRLERQAFDILNQKRAENGISPIKWSDDMAKIARLHSQDMAQYKYFSHSGRDGSMVNDRADSLGFSNWQAMGENIAFSRGFEKPVEFTCENWMKSPSHRQNILDTRWKEAGIGLAISPDGSYYFTEVFILK
jgi:uncharacterized protein YkwD